MLLVHEDPWRWHLRAVAHKQILSAVVTIKCASMNKYTARGRPISRSDQRGELIEP